jgi:hypothetical protein
MDCWYLAIMFGAIFNAQTATTSTMSPTPMGDKLGPMSQVECVAAKDALNKSSPMFHAQCQTLGGAQVIF